ncbi:MAG: O-methyltransferase [Candidatus Amulumruptor sp.]|nr:O-methyltransferase [Candidatus Amulumruptor sp.]
MTEALEDYILANISPEPAELTDVYRSTYLHHLYPRMCSGHLQGRILKLLTCVTRPRLILELGTFTGYSALAIAEGMPAGAQLHTIEIDDEMEPELTERFAASPRAADIRLHIGDALDLIDPVSREAGAKWDMVYIDANKRLYTEYFDALLPHMAPGALMIIDNTLWDGKVTDPAAHDAQTEAIRAFNSYLAEHPAVDTVAILPLRDGLTLATLKA